MRSGEINKRLLISSILALTLTGIPAYSYMTPEVNALYQQACSAEYQNNLPDAIEKLKKAISLSGNDSLLYTKLAGIYSEIGEYEKALAMYSKAIELKPNDAFVYISVGSIYEIQGKYDEALSAYNRAMQLFPEYKYNYLNIANVLHQKKDYKAATETYNRFLEIYPNHWDARENLAEAYLAQNLPQKAVVEYSKLYSKNSSNFKDYANFGIALVKTKNYSQAIDSYALESFATFESMASNTCYAF